MPQIANSTDSSEEAIQTAITMLIKLARRWRKTGGKRALYRFLQTVFDLYAAWKRAGDARTAVKRMARLAGLKHQADRHPIRTIIDATSTADRKSKSRWTQALRFAWRRRSKWKDLETCLRGNGGLAGCADKWADILAEGRTSQGFVRVGGEHFPKVPMFVHVSMLDQYGKWG